jgi:anti-sigma B factor antagonist
MGELDSYTAPDLRDAFAGVTESGHRIVVVDMAGLSYIDSTGLGVLVAALKRLREQRGELR